MKNTSKPENDDVEGETRFLQETWFLGAFGVTFLTFGDLLL
jgi:hypothetical protein